MHRQYQVTEGGNIMKTLSKFIVPIICMFASSTLLATEIFSTFGPDYSYNQTSYQPVNFYTSPEIIGTSLAFAFDVPGHSDFSLSEIKIAASWDGTKKNAHFLIFCDAAGVPADLPLLSLAVNPDALLSVSSVVSLPSPVALTLSAGQRYWLVAQPASLDSSVPADDYIPLWLSVDASILITSRVSYNSEPWPAWFAPAFSGAAPAFSVEATAVSVPALIDIMPGKYPNIINLKSGGLLSVAVLTDGTFDALQIDPGTARFGPSETAAVRYQVKDVDGDGDVDLLLKFRVPQTGIVCTDIEATLNGELYDGTLVAGTDSIQTKNCH
jgi:hypothetical protein